MNFEQPVDSGGSLSFVIVIECPIGIGLRARGLAAQTPNLLGVSATNNATGRLYPASQGRSRRREKGDVQTFEGSAIEWVNPFRAVLVA